MTYEEARGDELVEIPVDDPAWIYPGAVRWFTVTGADDATEAVLASGVPSLGARYDSLEHPSRGPDFGDMKCVSIEAEHIEEARWLVRAFYEVLT